MELKEQTNDQEKPYSTRILFRELSRFFVLAQRRKDKITPMPACPVDTYWHSIREDSETFRVLCVRYAGGHVTHIPSKRYTHVDWAEDYHAIFQEALHRVWFYSMDGSVFYDDAWQRYQAGSVQLEPDCYPQITAFSQVTAGLGKNFVDLPENAHLWREQ